MMNRHYYINHIALNSFLKNSSYKEILSNSDKVIFSKVKKADWEILIKYDKEGERFWFKLFMEKIRILMSLNSSLM